MSSFPAAPPRHRPPTPVTRAVEGRRVGGVCAGLAAARGVPVGWLRCGFVIAGLAAGLGVLVYLACWLIIPGEGEDQAEGDPGQRGIVLLAQVCAGLAGLATLATIGAGATIFGFGWVVVAIAAVLLVGALALWPRVRPGWVLLPVAALALPSVAVAAGHVRLQPRGGAETIAPATLAKMPAEGYRSGLGTLLVDLRKTALSPGRPNLLRIQAGVRRTIVALPHERCVNVRVRSHIVPFVARVAALATGRANRQFSEVAFFGRSGFRSRSDRTNVRRGGTGPMLIVDFTSEGGGLVVRDFPDEVDPQSLPDWPGYPVYPEPRPNITGTPRKAAQRLVRNWRARHRTQVRSKRQIDALMPGPCAAKAAQR